MEGHTIEDIAAKALDERDAFAGPRRHRDGDRSLRQTAQDLANELDARGHLAEAHEHAAVHVAVDKHGHLEIQSIVGRIARQAPHIDAAPRAAADIAAGGEAVHEFAVHDARADRAVEE
jgi:hypothetical protein